MLVKFNSEVGEFTMTGESALTLIKMMGHSGTIPGAILPEDIPAAIERLESAVKGRKAEPAPGQDTADADEEPVSLPQRAYPLLELLRNAARGNCSVMWDKATGSVY